MEEIKKPSYEELNDYCNQLMMQNRQLNTKLMQVMDIQNKLPFLFKVLKHSEYFTSDYINAVVDEIQLILPPYNPEEDTEDNEETEQLEA